MKKWYRSVLGMLFFFIGISIFFYPTIEAWHLEKTTEKYIEEFEEEYKETPEPDRQAKDSKWQDPVYQRCRQYNQTIFSEKQKGFMDPWSCVQIPFGLEQVEELGYIEIPSMNLLLPLYFGASQQNMARGAVVLAQTSLPVGGENANCVIAAHRGYRGAAFFRDIEKLMPEDEVLIHTPWDTLRYLAETAEIIEPCDSDRVKIQEGRDMVTLLTCHPYRSGGKYRYIVYCLRENENQTEEIRKEKTTEENKGNEPVVLSSKKDIHREDVLRKVFSAVLLMMSGMLVLQKIRNRKEKHHE